MKHRLYRKTMTEGWDNRNINGNKLKFLVHQMKMNNHSDERNKYKWTKDDLEDILKHTSSHKFNIHSTRITTESVLACIVDL
jgi:hypothetical protein